MRLNAKSLAAGLVLGAASLLCGCSAGYPDTEDRVENIDETIKKGNLQGRGNEARDQRFDKECAKSPSLPAAAAPTK